MHLRSLCAVVLTALALGACSSAPDRTEISDSTDPLIDQDNICLIFAQRPSWRDATQSTALRWGVPVELQMAIMWKESNFRPQARPPRTTALGVITTGYASSAYGYAQAIDGTWDWYRRETGSHRADRSQFAHASDFVGWYVNKTIETNGLSVYDAYNQYLAYHEGHTGYERRNWQRKAWLMRAAQKVAHQSDLYRRQMPTCTTY